MRDSFTPSVSASARRVGAPDMPALAETLGVKLSRIATAEPVAQVA